MATTLRFICSASSVALTLALGGCSTRYLPPPRMPERVAPGVVAEAPPPREGEGQVILDTVNGPARAEVVTERTQVLAGAAGWSNRGRYATVPAGVQLTTRPLCITPCAINLPFGQHELSFTSLDESAPRVSTGFINVTPHPSVVRHAMGFQETHLGGVIGSLLTGGFGVAAVLAGTMLIALNDDSHPSEAHLTAPGITTLSIGAALLATSVILGLHSRPESQAGSTVQWVPNP